MKHTTASAERSMERHALKCMHMKHEYELLSEFIYRCPIAVIYPIHHAYFKFWIKGIETHDCSFSFMTVLIGGKLKKVESE